MNTNPRLNRIAEVARVYYMENRTQAQIGTSMGISRSQVSRYLSEAREMGIVQIRIVPPGEESNELCEALKRRFPRLQDIVIAPIFDPSPDAVRAIIGRYAANYLLKVVKPGQRIAIGCGRTLHAMVKALPKGKISGVSVAQTMGNLGHEAHHLDYNEIARVAAEVLGGRVYYVSAPAILGPESRPAVEFIRANPMLEKALSVASQADLFIVGLGSMESDLVYTRFGLISYADLEALRGRAVGDICGRFYDIRGQAQPSTFVDRLVGVDLDAFARARMTIGVAGGPDKAAPILGAIRGGYINVLISDEQTAHSVLALDDAYPNQVVG